MDKNKQKQEMKTSNYVGLLVVVTLIVVLAGGFASYKLAKSTLHLNRIVAKKSVAKKTLDNNVVAAKSLVDSYAKVSSRKTFLEDALPDTPDFPAFGNAVEVVASTTGAQLLSVTSGLGQGSSVASASGTIPMAVAIKASTSYANLERFLAGLEASARPIHIGSIDFNGTNTQLDVTINALTYYQAADSFKIGKEPVK